MPTAAPDLPHKLVEHALLLLARQHGGDAATARKAEQALARWRRSSPAHEAAAQAALRGWAATDARSLQASVQLPPRASAGRRRAVSALGLFGLAALLGGVGRWHWLQPLQQLGLRTARGQTLARTLSDGSRLDLAPRTEAQVALFRDRREVRLLAGEIRFEVHGDAQRPFTVSTDWGRVRVLGTVFSVAVRGSSMEVAVAEGRVAVWALAPASAAPSEPSTPSTPDAELQAGQRLRVDAQGAGAPGRVAPGDVGSWRQGWLVFDRTPLPEVVARWNDYLAQPLRLADDAALHSLRLTGSFPLRDPAAFVDNLPQMLPLRTERTVGAVVLHARR